MVDRRLFLKGLSSGAAGAARGNDLTFILAGISLGLPPEGEIKAGAPFLVDAVSHFRQYHGDFARTVVVGEPSKEVQLRARAQQAAREATLDLCRAGVKYSTIRAAGFETYKKAGGDPDTLIVNPHSVGFSTRTSPTGMTPRSGSAKISYWNRA